MTYSVDTIELRKAMIERDITTITMLAEKTGINRTTVGDVVNGKSKPSTAVIEKISRELALDSADVGRIFFSQKLA